MLFSRLLAIIWVLGIVSGQPTLPADEVESLRVIARTLRKSDWNFNVNPCNGSSGWVTQEGQNPNTGYANRLTCDCTFLNNTTCHVVSIVLKAQNLSGSVPRDLIRLPFLRAIDLSRNYLNGTIPPEWGSMYLVNISLVGNRVTGRIPRELANISTLANLTLEYNQLSGTIPLEFGNFTRIETLTLNSNNLTGELPATLERLSTLIDFRINDNNFRGIIPNFIQNWTNIKRLWIQGSGLSGPIPAGTAYWPNLMDLRISDLSGDDSAFPYLRNIRGLKILILRSCNIVGQLPVYDIGDMSRLRVLDLSFNKLSGPIPHTYIDLQETDYVYLTGNSLSGPVPDWILNYAENVDLSYNNFTPPNPNVCQPRSVNLFASSKGSTSGIVSCLQPTSCEREYYSLHINCGGRQVDYGKGTIYEDDYEAGGASNYVPSRTNWGFSSTGHFLNSENPRPSFVWQNISVISGDNPQLYSDARLSPLSLTYYGFCLRNGNYTVNLHFAEIILRNDRTYYSVGRRLFDVYIQGQRVLKDFNIESEAGGVNMGIRKNFTVVVSDTTLDIRFYWAGKGTTGIPFRGVYGPLISAISVDPNYTPPGEIGYGRISTSAVVGIVLGVALMFLLVLGIILWWKGCLRGKDEVHNGMILGATGIVFLTTNEESNYRAVETFLLQHGLQALKRYKYSEIKKMTKSFSDKLGQGGYGSVYKGNLHDGTLIAVKLLSAVDENVEDFINEVASISRTSHVNIVRLLGFCFDRKKRALVYEYMPNKSLDKYISKSGSACCLDLEILYKIAVGVAEGLDYLHRGCNTRIVHFDIKPQNILLDEDFCPKISDFGLAKLCKKKQSLLSVLGTRGTVGYIAPEVFSRNYGGVSHKSDVYSYGMMVLDMVGANMIADHTNETTQSTESYFPDKIYELVFDKTMKLDGFTTEVIEETGTKMLLIGFWCIQTNPLDRPSISTVVEMLEGRLESIQIPPKPVLFTPTVPVWGVSSSFSSFVETQPSAEDVTQTHFKVPENGSS